MIAGGSCPPYGLFKSSTWRYRFGGVSSGAMCGLMSIPITYHYLSVPDQQHETYRYWFEVVADASARFREPLPRCGMCLKSSAR